MAVEENSFGGWLMAWREMKDTGIDPDSDFSSVLFGGTHDAVVKAVAEGRVDANALQQLVRATSPLGLVIELVDDPRLGHELVEGTHGSPELTDQRGVDRLLQR